MNTLVQNGDGDGDGDSPPPSPREAVPASPGADVPVPARDRTTCDLASAEATLFEVVVPADNMTLVEVAPQSGQTLIMPPDARPAAPRTPRTDAAGATAAPRATAGAGLAAALGLARPQRLRVWGPVLACVLSLGATALPLWRRAPRSAAEGRGEATTVAAPAPRAAASDLDNAGPGAGAPVTNSEAATSQPGDGSAAQPQAPGRRRHPLAGTSARRKSRGPVLRTRNGAPLID